EHGEVDSAAQSFAKAAELDPRCFVAFQNWGAVLEAQGDLRGASEKYQAALDLKPKYDGLYYNMAYLLEKLNMRSEAGRWYKRFHELAGKYPYDPKHIVSLQQEEARERARSAASRKN
ncbi:MAG TPA: tetratricopeptide repeat protein, partial [Candidatus Obscuribacter sp.]|nr:tetratricopeptide repeat protein [Candidatus Obscuribacter sp.]